nr:hypothetical protein [Tanacetum cinerariifolium]
PPLANPRRPKARRASGSRRAAAVPQPSHAGLRALHGAAQAGVRRRRAGRVQPGGQQR